MNKYFIVQIGVGGNGGAIAQAVAQMLATQAHVNSVYVVADPDVVEKKNIGNQLFVSDDVGLSKASVLADRYGYAYGINMRSYTRGYIEDVQTLYNLYCDDFCHAFELSDTTCILLGCVDNNYTRQIMNEFFQKSRNLIYIDVGNESCDVPADFLSRSYERWTKEEQDAYDNSGWSGQVVIGQRKHGRTEFLPMCDVFPDVLEDIDEIKPSELSCAALTASEPQRFITNRFAATAVIGALQLIFLTDKVPYHVVHFHAQRGYMRTVEKMSIDVL